VNRAPFRESRILIVDDDPSNVLLVERLLAEAGYTNLRSTTDARRAVPHCAEFRPDLIVLDLVMQHMDGIHLLRELRWHTATETFLPILVLTADVSPESQRHTLAAGANDFVTKPFDPAEVVIRVRNLLETRSLHAELRRRNQDLESQVRERTQQLIEADRLTTMGNLLAGVAHELNNPLSVVAGHAAMFLETAGDGPLRARAEKIAVASDRCVRIVKSFLAMARRRPPERGSVSVNQVIRDVVDLLAYELQVSEVDVRLYLSTDVPLVWADEDQLHQVIVNLVANAHQAMCVAPAPRRLSLTTRYDGANERVFIEVADTGPGIPGGIQGRIFEPFFTTKSEGQGTGLGLALTRGIVDSHGGSIGVSSRPGEGACFRVELPVGAPRPAAAAVAAREPDRVIRDRSILIVDDEPSVAAVLAEALTNEGHVVETAENGAVGLEKLAAGSYDLVICDSGMPVLNGPDLYREVERRDPRLAEKFIFVVGDILNPRTQEFLDHVNTPQLIKPFTIETVKQLVRRVLSAH
jgi:signal transduction histidine kinase